MNIRGKEIPNTYIIISAVVLLLLVAGLYFLFRGDADGDGFADDTFFGILFGGNIASPGADQTGSGGTLQNEENELYLFRISDGPVVGATLSGDKEHVQYYKQTSGHLFRNDFRGEKEERISNITILALQEALWTPSKKYAVVSYYSDAALRRLYFKYQGTTTASSASLPPEIISIATSNTSDAIAYTVPSANGSTLFTANPDNTNIKNVYASPITDFEVSWPASNRIALKTKSSAYAESHLFTINPLNKSISRILAGREGLDVLWAPDGSTFLYMETRRNGTIPVLRIADTASATETEFPFITLPEKCVWAPANKDRVLYCAVPQTTQNAALPDDWWKGSVSFNDSLWRINVDTGINQELYSVHQLDAITLFVPEDESFLFFTNKKDGILWSLRLK